MEKLLGVKADAEAFTTHEQWVKSRSNVIETDTMDQVDGNDPARSRYQHMFWEPVAEGSVSHLSRSVNLGALILSAGTYLARYD